MIWLTVTIVALGLCTANFIFQACTLQDWALAFERSYFQAVACFTIALVDFTARWLAGHTV